MVGWYARFLQNLADVRQPLTDLTKKDRPWKWGEAQQKAFETIKQMLTEAPVLARPNPNLPFTIQTDASNFALGAVLSQETDGHEHPIAYASRTLNKAERNYTTTEKECLAVIWAVNKFRGYILGSQFTNSASSKRRPHPITLKQIRSNEPIETIKTMMSIFAEADHRLWDTHLSEFIYAINTVKNTSTKYTPAYLNFGRHPRSIVTLRNELQTADDNLLNLTTESWAQRIERLPAIYRFVKENLANASLRQANYYNKNRRDIQFQVGDKVLRRNHVLSSTPDNFAKNLASKFTDPLLITNILSQTVYEATDEKTGQTHKVHIHSKPRPNTTMWRKEVTKGIGRGCRPTPMEKAMEMSPQVQDITNTISAKELSEWLQKWQKLSDELNDVQDEATQDVNTSTQEGNETYGWIRVVENLFKLQTTNDYIGECSSNAEPADDNTKESSLNMEAADNDIIKNVANIETVDGKSHTLDETTKQESTPTNCQQHENSAELGEWYRAQFKTTENLLEAHNAKNEPNINENETGRKNDSVKTVRFNIPFYTPVVKNTNTTSRTTTKIPFYTPPQQTSNSSTQTYVQDEEFQFMMHTGIQTEPVCPIDEDRYQPYSCRTNERPQQRYSDRDKRRMIGGEPVCWTCMKEGHKAKTCPKKTQESICWNCDEKGHLWGCCPHEPQKRFCPTCGRENYDKKSCAWCKIIEDRESTPDRIIEKKSEDGYPAAMKIGEKYFNNPFKRDDEERKLPNATPRRTLLPTPTTTTRRPPLLPTPTKYPQHTTTRTTHPLNNTPMATAVREVIQSSVGNELIRHTDEKGQYTFI
ncbi:unnamed protein product [Trichogramma brassicae]|uniref:RNA-directed DNA polymerase n=1 Tax=Trichogramma brassicae TaxID=86971 RepID=A0A6H5II40_9HYME|nr:unnamed protein product [Trichogramma brassicae]